MHFSKTYSFLPDVKATLLRRPTPPARPCLVRPFQSTRYLTARPNLAPGASSASLGGRKLRRAVTRASSTSSWRSKNGQKPFFVFAPPIHHTTAKPRLPSSVVYFFCILPRFLSDPFFTHSITLISPFFCSFHLTRGRHLLSTRDEQQTNKPEEWPFGEQLDRPRPVELCELMSRQYHMLPSLLHHRLARPCLIACVVFCVGMFLSGSISISSILDKRMTSFRLHSSNHHYDNTTHSYCPWCTDPVLCARKFLFVVATGRSGSTTVMDMLNGVPGIFISGENFGEMGLLRQLYNERAQTRKEMIRITGQFPATTNQADNNDTIVDHAELLAIQAWIWEANLPPPSLVTPQPDIVGFKEIRWTAEDVAFAQRA